MLPEPGAEQTRQMLHTSWAIYLYVKKEGRIAYFPCLSYAKSPFLPQMRTEEITHSWIWRTRVMVQSLLTS